MAQKLCADVFVIGAGPAGLSAALALCRQKFRTIVFDSGVYRNARSKHMHMVPTWDHRDAKDFRQATREQILERYDTTLFVDQRVDKLEKIEGGNFKATCGNGRSYTAKRVVLATGVTDQMLDIKGYSDAWASSIFHCLFCHGYEESGGDHAGVLAVGMTENKQMGLTIAANARRLAKRITVYTHGNKQVADDFKADAAKLSIDVDARKVVEIAKVPDNAHDLILHFEDGATQRLSFLQHAPNTKPNGPFADQLGLEVSPMGEYKVASPMPATNVPGIFAAGDAGTPIKSVSMAISGGGMAAAAISHSLAMEPIEAMI